VRDRGGGRPRRQRAPPPPRALPGAQALRLLHPQPLARVAAPLPRLRGRAARPKGRVPPEPGPALVLLGQPVGCGVGRGRPAASAIATAAVVLVLSLGVGYFGWLVDAAARSQAPRAGGAGRPATPSR